MTLRKLLCKPRDRVATEDKDNIVYEIDCSNCQESKRYLKSRSYKHKRSVRNYDYDKNETAKQDRFIVSVKVRIFTVNMRDIIIYVAR